MTRIERSVRVDASMVSLWLVGVCRGIISLARIGVKYDDPGCNIVECDSKSTGQ